MALHFADDAVMERQHTSTNRQDLLSTRRHRASPHYIRLRYDQPQYTGVAAAGTGNAPILAYLQEGRHLSAKRRHVFVRVRFLEHHVARGPDWVPVERVLSNTGSGSRTR